MSRALLILIGASWVGGCGAVCAASFKATGKSAWRGFALGAVLGPLGVALCMGWLVISRTNSLSDTGTFAAPRAKRDQHHGGPDVTGTFARPFSKRRSRNGESSEKGRKI